MVLSTDVSITKGSLLRSWELGKARPKLPAMTAVQVPARHTNKV